MELVERRGGVSNTVGITSLKRSRSFRASVKLMSKIRNRAEAYHAFNTIVEDENNRTRKLIEHLPRDNVEKESAVNVGGGCIDSAAIFHSISSDMTTKLSLNCSDNVVIKNKKYESITPSNIHHKHNENISNNSINNIGKSTTVGGLITAINHDGGYENPSFALDNSFDSSITSYLYEPINEENDQSYIFDEKKIDNRVDLMKKSNGKLSIIVGQFDNIKDTTITATNECNNKYSKKKTMKTLDNVTSSWFGSRATSFRQKIRVDSLLDHSARPLINDHCHSAYVATTLFTAIEYGHLDKAKTILESGDIDVNSVNGDGLSPLDVAVLGNNKSLVKMLVAYGAREGNQFRSPESLGSHLASLMLSAERRLSEVGGPPGTSATSFLEAPNARASFSAAHNNLTGCGGTAEDKQVALWERRVRTLRKMLLGFDQARPPDIPFLVGVDVIGTKTVIVRFQEADTLDSFICTKFKVQWSIKEDFSLITGEREMLDMKQRECRIDGLVQGQRYYFRACAGNLKGYSRFVFASPPSVTPSNMSEEIIDCHVNNAVLFGLNKGWRDIDGRLPRFAGRLQQLDSLFVDIQRPEYAQDTPALQRRNHKKKTTIKQLFTATSKFQKSLRRGVYLACLLYHEDKVLVTNEDFLPVIEVDETYPSCIYNDFHWLMKVACTWDNVKTLRQDMEKSHGSPMNHFRLKLLQAAAQMQAALCIQDLGQIYHKPIRDVQGTLVISTVNYIKSPKLISVLNSRWLPLNKLTKKIVIHEDSNVADILMTSVQDQMTYHQLSSVKLSRGLYLGYMKMQSSVDLIQIVVPAKAPNVLPHCKIRDNPHVSAEEWNYLRRIMRIQASETLNNDCDNDEKENSSNDNYATEQEKMFVNSLAATARRLFSYMEISPDDSQIHRLYDAEVIELTNDVSFVIIVPPAETACLVPGTREMLLQRGDLLSLPIQVFEMVHLNAYQKDVINRYSKLSCILELDTAQAQHNHREAFSSMEVAATKDKLTRLQELQSQMNSVWKGARWLIDVITFARDRGSSQCVLSGAVGVCIRHLLNIESNNKSNGHSLKRSLLQLPPRDPKLVKSSPGRGSWPGPNVSNSTSNLLTAEFSKSEQQLPISETPSDPARLHINCHRNNDHVRKGSDTSNLSTGSEPIRSSVPFLSESIMKLPPSKSEDTLSLSQYKHVGSISGSVRNRSAAVTSISAGTSPQLGNKPIVYGRSLLGVSTTTLTNTTSLLSVTSTNSDSLHSINSDDYTTTAASSSVNLKSSVHNKNKLLKPTASVAAMATTPMDTHLDELKDQSTLMPAPMPGILQVYAAYETGLASGTSLKLHVTPRTTAREVVDLVVKQLNMAVVLKGQEGPIYTSEELPNFCLVAVIGARERCLRDDFKPLQLQNPWKKGRLYVRLKQDVLAALEHSSKHTAYL
ncbi:hypothetical protein PV326_002758 [Microctonus aethiopoides]|nr:hypothetical protein PV326_002758 [Microctonus aethiopoides]